METSQATGTLLLANSAAEPCANTRLVGAVRGVDEVHAHRTVPQHPAVRGSEKAGAFHPEAGEEPPSPSLPKASLGLSRRTRLQPQQ